MGNAEKALEEYKSLMSQQCLAFPLVSDEEAKDRNDNSKLTTTRHIKHLVWASPMVKELINTAYMHRGNQDKEVYTIRLSQESASILDSFEWINKFNVKSTQSKEKFLSSWMVSSTYQGERELMQWIKTVSTVSCKKQLNMNSESTIQQDQELDKLEDEKDPDAYGDDQGDSEDGERQADNNSESDAEKWDEDDERDLPFAGDRSTNRPIPAPLIVVSSTFTPIHTIQANFLPVPRPQRIQTLDSQRQVVPSLHNVILIHTHSCFLFIHVFC